MRRIAFGVAVAVVVLVAAGCHRDRTGPSDAAGGPAPGAGSASPSDMPSRAVTLLFPSTTADGLVAVDAQIFATSSVVDQAKQVVGLLLQGPATDGLASPLPKGTTLRSIFIDGRGTAFVNLSREASSAAPGGSAWEILAVNSLAGSLARSVPQIKRVQILVDDQEIQTLTGHLDLRGPVELDPGLIIQP